MEETTRIIMMYTIFIVMFYVVIITTIIEHERAHVQIASTYGHNTTYTINYLKMSGETINHDKKPITETENLLHNQNEIVGYHTAGIILTLMLTAVIISTTIEAKIQFKTS